MVTPKLLTEIHELAPLIDLLDGSDRLAVDTEFHPERRTVPELFVVSIAVPGGTPFVLDAKNPELLEALASHVAGKQWVLHSARQDLLLLRPTLGAPSSVFDTQIAAGLCTTVYPAGFSWLLREILAAEPEPEATMSDWSVRPLSTRQLRYAAGDVARLCELADCLQDRLDSLGRSELATDVTKTILEAESRRTWRHIRGADTLTPLAAAILEELVVFRDRLASETGTSPSAVLADGHLLDLAKRQPMTRERIEANRRFPRRFATQHGERLAELIQRVSRRSPHLLPVRFTRGSQEEAHRAGIWASILMQGQADQWAAGLVAPPRVVDELAAGIAPRGWRAHLLGRQIGLRAKS
ncbi:MAG: HRDC domain-containing protein [Proteobacteria bacterium]|nr:HRDC domain-containing protein [Pseudomonadota bacterium]